jgi:hypothetical protein
MPIHKAPPQFGRLAAFRLAVECRLPLFPLTFFHSFKPSLHKFRAPDLAVPEEFTLLFVFNPSRLPRQFQRQRIAFQYFKSRLDRQLSRRRGKLGQRPRAMFDAAVSPERCNLAARLAAPCWVGVCPLAGCPAKLVRRGRGPEQGRQLAELLRVRADRAKIGQRSRPASVVGFRLLPVFSILAHGAESAPGAGCGQAPRAKQARAARRKGQKGPSRGPGQGDPPKSKKPARGGLLRGCFGLVGVRRLCACPGCGPEGRQGPS